MVVNGYPHVSRILKQIGPRLAGVVAMSVAVLIVDRYNPIRRVTVPDVSLTVIGVVLSILLGFRTNSAYARWWEGRQLWGAMVNTSRTMCRQALSFASDAEAGRRLVGLQLAFVHACRCALRRQYPWADVDRFVDPAVARHLRARRNVPAAILQQMGADIAAVSAAGHLTEQRLQQLDDTVTALSNVIGGLERIKNTPLPRQYDVYPELFIYLYCLVLPVVLVDELKGMTPVVVLLVAGMFLVLNQVGKNLEDPFENRPYDVPMSALCRTIEIDLRQAMGEVDVPGPLTPERGVLW